MKGPRSTRFWLTLGVALASCSFLLAQDTGTVRGRITDREANPLPGVTVTLHSETNPSVNSVGTVTDAKGEYRIPNLPPGDDYKFSASFPGLTTVIRGPLEVPSARTTTVDFILVLELVERVRVEAQGSIVDTTSTVTSTAISAEFIAELPVLGRSYTDLLTLAPGVTDTDGDGRPNVHGAREEDFQYKLGGVNITDPFGIRDDVPPPQINIDAIEEIQVITGAATAEYGGAQGGFASVTTKSGGNEFQGSFKVFYQTRSVDNDGAANEDAFHVPSEPGSFRTLNPFLTAGGAFRRDRLWYFLALQYIDKQEPINILGVQRNQTTEGWNNIGKVTWQINTSVKTSLEARYDPLEYGGLNLGLGISPGSDYTLEQTSPLFTSQTDWVITPTVLLTGTLSILNIDGEVRPVTEPSDLPIPCPGLILSNPELWELTCKRLPNDSYTINGATGQIFGPFPEDQNYESSRFTAKTDLSYYVDDLLGSHQLKFGFEWAPEEYETTITRRPGRYETPVRGSQALNLWYDFEARTQLGSADADVLGVYVQDSWRIRPNLTLNLGLRLEYENVRAPGRTIFDPAAERAEFNQIAARVYSNFDSDPLVWTEASGLFNGCENELTDCLEATPPGSRPCDIGGPDGAPDGVCDSFDRVAISRVFHRHGAERAPSRFFSLTPGEEEQFQLPECGDPRRQGTCRDDEDIELDNTNLAPRVSITYDPFADGKTKLFATWGRFYNHLFLSTVTPELTRDFDYISMASTNDIFVGSPQNRNFHIYQVSRDLRTPFTDETTIGFEREISPEFSISVIYTRRKGRDQIQSRDINHFTRDQNLDGIPDDNFGQFSESGELVTGPDTFPDLFTLNPFFGGIFHISNFNISDYKGLELHLRKRLHRNWLFDASYTYSEAVGNAEAFESGLGSDTSQVDHEFGFLSFDERHVVKFNAVTHFPKGIQFGTRITWESGLPFSLIRSGFTTDENGNPTFRAIFPTQQRNDQRNNGRWLIDLNLRKDFNVGPTSMGVEFSVFNLLNSDDLQIGSINDQFIAFQLVDGTERRFGRRFQLGFRMNF